jgi:hypothetical protein
LNFDIVNYGINEADDDYFNEIIDFFKINDVEIMNALLELEENLPIKNYTLEEVIGDEDNFSNYIETLIDDNHITYQKALDIKGRLKRNMKRE